MIGAKLLARGVNAFMLIFDCRALDADPDRNEERLGLSVAACLGSVADRKGFDAIAGQIVDVLLLRVRQRGVRGLKSRREFFDAVCMSVGYVRIASAQ